MTTREISSQLSNKIEGLAILLIGLDKGRVSAVELFKEIVTDGQKEGLSADELKALVRDACLRRGLSDRTYYRYLPADLKDPIKVKARLGAEVKSDDTMSSEKIADLERQIAALKEQLRQKDIIITELEEALAQLSRPVRIA